MVTDGWMFSLPLGPWMLLPFSLPNSSRGKGLAMNGENVVFVPRTNDTNSLKNKIRESVAALFDAAPMMLPCGSSAWNSVQICCATEFEKKTITW